jgi:large subunit ribosomal protein L3
MKGILGRKAGMTTVFANDGRAVPVTVIEVKPNVVLQVKTAEVDGYNSIKLGVEDKKDQRATKAELGIAKKANTSAKYFIKEIKDMDGEYSLGQSISADSFEAGEYVDVTGISKGKGFQGSIKRHNQTRGPMSHGSKSHRVTGSLGDIRGTVKKTKKMPGHMGHEQVTMQNLEVVAIDMDNNVILIKGSIPGPNKSFVIIKTAVKKDRVENAVVLVDVKLEHIKNELLEEAKKVGADVNTSMDVQEMKDIIAEATVRHEEELKEHAELIKKAEALEISKANKMKLDELRDAVTKAEELAASRAEEVVEEKAAPAEETPAAEEAPAVEEASTEEVVEEDKKEEEP